MHEPPRSDAAGLQTPKKLLRLTRFKGEAIDGVVYLIPEDADTPYAADDPECVYLAAFVDGELAALRARTEGLQAAIDTLVRTVNDQARRLVELQQDYEASLNRWNTANGQAHAVIDAEAARADAAEAELTALLASHETLQAERDAANAEAHVYLENTTRLRARVTALDAERDALQQQLKEWKRRWLVEKERHGTP